MFAAAGPPRGMTLCLACVDVRRPSRPLLHRSFPRRALSPARLPLPRPSRLRVNGLVLLVRALEIGDLVISFEVPDAGRHFVDQVMVVCDQQNRPLIAL